jgi:hypothetical protein
VCQRGHGLGEKSYEADRWVAATARYDGASLVSHDGVFIDAPGIELITNAFRSVGRLVPTVEILGPIERCGVTGT